MLSSTMRRSTSGMAWPVLMRSGICAAASCVSCSRVRRGQAHDRAGFRHAVADKHIHAARQRSVRQPFGERRAADDHFQAGQINILARGWVSSMCKMVGTHCEKVTFLVRSGSAGSRAGSGVNLLDAQQGGDIRNAPGVHMEHRRNRHVHASSRCRRPCSGLLARPSAADRVCSTSWRWLKTPLGQAGGAGGVKVVARVCSSKSGKSNCAGLAASSASYSPAMLSAAASCGAPSLSRMTFHRFQLGADVVEHRQNSAFTSSTLGRVVHGVDDLVSDRRTFTLNSTLPIIGTAK